MKDWLDLKIGYLVVRRYTFWNILRKLKQEGITLDKQVLLKRIKK